jgi:enoyl-CoA hydratase/carnithine racemase
MSLIITQRITEAFAWQHWHINRPERLNALGTTLAAELTDSLELLRQSPPADIRALVITAASVHKGDRSIWIAGGDLKELARLRDRRAAKAYASSMRVFCESLERLPFPVITVIDGAAIGGGAELALAGDIRLATVRSSLEFKQLKIGLATGYGAASRLVQLLGKSKAQSLLYFCETVDAEQAHASGLVHRLITGATPEEIGKAILPILSLEPTAVSAQKKMLRLATEAPGSANTWSDDIFESIWLNDSHASTLSSWI